MNYLKILIAFLLIGATQFLQAQNTYIDWQEDDVYGQNYVSNKLLKMGPNGLNYGVVYGQEYLQVGKSGMVAMKIVDPLNNILLGLNNDQQELDYKKLKFSVIISGGKISIAEGGKVKGVYGTVKRGELIEIRIRKKRPYVYKNGKLLYASKLLLIEKMYIAAAIDKRGDHILGAYTTFKSPVTIDQSIVQHIDKDLKANTGTATILPVGGTAPYTVLWGDGTSGVSRSDLAEGMHNIEIKDGDNELFQFTVDVYDKNHFEIMQGTVEDDDISFLKTTTSPDKAVVQALETIPSAYNGKASVRITDQDQRLGFAFVNSTSTDILGRFHYGIEIIDSKVYFTDSFDKPNPDLLLTKRGTDLTVKTNDLVTFQKIMTDENTFDIVLILNKESYTLASDLTTIVRLGFAAKLTSNLAKIFKPTIIRDKYVPPNTQETYTPEPPEAINWRETETFDLTGSKTSKSRVYSDTRGNAIQVQSFDFANSSVLAQETIYDEFGRPVLETLSAPTYQEEFEYKGDFITNELDEQYSYLDFDNHSIGDPYASGGKYNPKKIKDTDKGTLGWYYSDNNTEEAYTPADDLPFSRVEYSDMNVEEMAIATGVGENFHLGKNNYIKTYKMPSGATELKFLTGTNLGKAYKQVTINMATGITKVDYINSEGDLFASLLTGEVGDNINPTVSSHRLRAYPIPKSKGIHKTSGTGYIIYSPSSSHGTEHFTHYTPHLIDQESRDTLTIADNLSNCNGCACYLSTMDIDGTAHGKIVFTGDYESKGVVLDLYFEHTPGGAPTYSPYDIHSVNVSVPLLYVTGESNSRWTINTYDERGRLTEAYDPNSIAGEDFSLTDVEEYVKMSHNSFDLDETLVNYDLYDEINDSFPINTTLVDQIVSDTTAEYISRELHINVVADGENVLQEFDLLTYVITDVFTEAELAQRFGPDWAELGTCGYVSQEYPVGTLSSFHDEAFDLQEVFGELNAEGITSSHHLNSTNFHSTYTDRDAPRDLPNDDVNCFDHCHDGVLNCGEFEIDHGGEQGCAKCYDYLSPNYINFRIKLDVLLDDVVVKTITAEPSLWRNCECKFNWFMDRVNIHLKEEEYSPDQNLKIQVSEILAQGVGEEEYTPISTTNFDHFFGRLLNLKIATSQEYIIDPVVTAYRPAITATQPAEGYEYNDLDLLVKNTNKDSGTSRFQYDSKRRLRFSQTEQEKSEDKFSYVTYDEISRVIETGTLTQTAGGLVFDFGDGTDQVPPGMGASILFVDSNLTSVTGGRKILNSSYYDLPSSELALLQDYGTLIQQNLIGRVSMAKNDETTIWYSYNWLGQPEWTLRYIVSDDSYHLMEYTYDQTGRLKNTAYEADDNESFYHKYYYDVDKRISQVWTSREPNSNYTVQAVYKYDQTGNMIRKELGEDLQGLDFVYMINGRLKSINNPEFSRDPGKDGLVGSHQNFHEDLFGLTLDYYENDYRRANSKIQSYAALDSQGGYVDNKYDHTIKSARWQMNNSEFPTEINGMQHSGNQLMYSYEYDEIGQLTAAKFGIIDSGSLGTQNSTNSTERINSPTANFLPDYGVNNITYDLNGNIQSLKRSGYQNGGIEMDEMTYNYKLDANNRPTNILDYVKDTIPNTYPDDFEGQLPGNYTYDLLGRMTHDASNGTYFKYNEFNLVQGVYKDASYTLKINEFTYDENGLRLTKMTYGESNAPLTKTTYIRDASGSVIRQIEMDISDSQNIAELGDNYMVYGVSSEATYSDTDSMYTYQITDHLGNVRLVISEVDEEMNLISANDYYPFGSSLEGRSHSTSTSSLQVHSGGFQGQEQDKEIGLISFELRQYNSQLGRWLTPDPYRQHWSPYAAMSNNPISFVDPDGGYDINIASVTVDNVEAMIREQERLAELKWVELQRQKYGSLGETDFEAAIMMDDASWFANQNFGNSVPFKMTRKLRRKLGVSKREARSYTPVKISELFAREYNMQVTVENGMLIYVGDSEVKSDLPVSQSARKMWIEELKATDEDGNPFTSKHSLTVTADRKNAEEFIATNSRDPETGVSNTVIDLSIFNGASDMFAVNTDVYIPGTTTTVDLLKRAQNLGRVLEHEFLGHGVLGYKDDNGPNMFFNPRNSPGRTVQVVNRFRAQMGLPLRKNYIGFAGISHDPSTQMYQLRFSGGSTIISNFNWKGGHNH